MCKVKGVNVGIKDIDFTSHRGKMAVRLTDGREIIIPVSFFPDIDDQYFTFENMTRVYSIFDLFSVA